MIVDQEYYINNYDGDELSEFNRLNLASQSFLESLTNRTAEELSGLPAAALDKVRQAICAEIEYLHTLGGVKAVNGKPDVQKKSESYAGSYSYALNEKQMANIRYVNGIPYAPMIDTLLASTGLLYTGVDYV